MAKIIEYKEIPLDRLVIGKGQARTQDLGKDIGELAESIKLQGLLQPIVVCPAKETGKWEILTGQRRFLAHRFLKKNSITAAVLNERVAEKEAKAISITENLIRRKLSGKELTDGILYLYNIYGTMKSVVETTGIPYNTVKSHVKYPRLITELKKMVDSNEIDIKTALKAQDAATLYDGEPNPETAITLAKEMCKMTGVQQNNIAKLRKNSPDKPIDDVIEEAKTGHRLIQIVATVTQNTHTAINQYAQEIETTQDEAIVDLIEEALDSYGLLDG